MSILSGAQGGDWRERFDYENENKIKIIKIIKIFKMMVMVMTTKR